MIFEFNKGGGEVDLNQATTDRKGTFYVKFDFQGFAVPETLKVYYVSGGLMRRVDGKVVGTGCKSFYDVTKYISTISFKDGMAVNTTRDLHLSVLGGHFIFSYIKDKQTYVTQVTFKDSAKSNFLCENLLEKKAAAEKKLREGSAG